MLRRCKKYQIIHTKNKQLILQLLRNTLVNSAVTVYPIHLDQGFSNYGSRKVFWGRETNWLDKTDIIIFVNFTRKLTVGLQRINCIFRGNIMLCVISCLLRCLPELSNDNNEPSTTSYVLLCQDCFDVLTNIDLIAFILT